MQRTLVGTCAKSMLMASSSPAPLCSPATWSPLCDTPYISSTSQSTAPRISPLVDTKTAEMSMSMSCLLPGCKEPPMPTKTRFNADVLGKGTMAPFVISKDTFKYPGAVGISLRIRLPMFGSRMSKKCEPKSAGSSTCTISHPWGVLLIIATTSQSPPLRSSEKERRHRPSSRTLMTPLSTSLRWPSPYTATTKMISFTWAGNFDNRTHMDSS
mmetsp:Transcript_174945/g.561003  ORF Transcript_174945/g.561003 Transcript_174945/m.561003 type:complete len:213 (-) Transcript_174945:288-926(-)